MRPGMRPDRPGSHRPPPPSYVKHVRHHFHGYDSYWTRDWYRHHPGAWNPWWIPSYRWWHRPVWYDTWGWYGAGFFTGYVVNGVLNPCPYYYGNNIVYQGDMVYVNGVPYVSASEYYRQAAELARSVEVTVVQQAPPVELVDDPILAPPENVAGQHAVAKPPADAEDWLPLGSYAVMRAGEDEENPQNIMQLATNRKGEIRGNYYSEDSGQARQLAGAVDSKTQRVALRFLDDDQVVLECGLWNLTQETAPMLVHFDENETEQLTLVRLTNSDQEQPPVETAPKAGPLLPDQDGELAP